MSQRQAMPPKDSRKASAGVTSGPARKEGFVQRKKSQERSEQTAIKLARRRTSRRPPKSKRGRMSPWQMFTIAVTVVIGLALIVSTFIAYLPQPTP